MRVDHIEAIAPGAPGAGTHRGVPKTLAIELLPSEALRLIAELSAMLVSPTSGAVAKFGCADMVADGEPSKPHYRSLFYIYDRRT